MGIYINTGNIGFQRVRNSEYIDKSGLISVVNSTLFTERGFTCVTRCRRFGKSMAAKMPMLPSTRLSASSIPPR